MKWNRPWQQNGSAHAHTQESIHEGISSNKHTHSRADAQKAMQTNTQDLACTSSCCQSNGSFADSEEACFLRTEREIAIVTPIIVDSFRVLPMSVLVSGPVVDAIVVPRLMPVGAGVPIAAAAMPIDM